MDQKGVDWVKGQMGRWGEWVDEGMGTNNAKLMKWKKNDIRVST